MKFSLSPQVTNAKIESDRYGYLFHCYFEAWEFFDKYYNHLNILNYLKFILKT
jgi:hypothetical protein